MRKIFLIIILLGTFTAAFGNETTLTLSRSSYDLDFKNIARIENMAFEDTQDLIIVSGPLKASLSNNRILLEGIDSETIIERLSLPRGVAFTIQRPMARIWFQNGEYKVETQEGRSLVEKGPDGLFVRHDDNIVKITDRGIFVSSDGEHVSLSDEGIHIKGDEGEVRLGLLGKIISFFTRKAVTRSLESAFKERDMLHQSLNDLLENRVPDFSVLESDTGISFRTESDRQEKSKKTSTETYIYKNIRHLDLSLVSSSVVISPAAGKDVLVKIIKKNVPESGYKILMNQKEDSLKIAEEIKHSAGRLSVHFIIEIPPMETVHIKGLSSSIELRQINSRTLSLQNLSGHMSLLGPEGDSLILKNTSGDIYLKNAKFSNEIKLSTISGDVKGSDMISKELIVETTSGDFRGEQISVGKAALKTVSGDFSIRDMDSDSVDFNSTSGDLFCERCTWGGFKGRSVSGDVDFKRSEIKDRSFSSVSGDLTLSSLFHKQNRPVG
ncbi:MAG TPA: hypothetical protein ENN72_09035 [Firmicutes bacterium]|nr:hypothetical protein [Bacillota bacterium]